MVELDRPGLRRAVYRAIVREGTRADQEALLNASLLKEVWPELLLPERCRTLWEMTFPELAKHGRTDRLTHASTC